ncbi:MAG: hypothetical protein HYV65_01565 [Candidatus Spechtbacteria bacterium]|nr:hypothetical protein [Candidatus Spechtbacteria bacterium]
MKILRKLRRFIWPLGLGKKIFVAGCALAVVVWFWPYPFSYDMELYNNASRAMKNEQEQVDGLKIFSRLASDAKDKKVREASAYNFGTGLAQNKDYGPSRAAEEALKQAVRLDSRDEDAKLNLEILLSLRHQNETDKKDLSSPAQQQSDQSSQGNDKGDGYGRGESPKDY